MACEWIDADSRIMRARLSGLMTGADRTAIESRAKQAIGRFGSVRCLFVLEDFTGWQKGVDWGDLSFQQEYDGSVERIAVVGPEQWRDEALAFMAAPLRSTEIRFFDTSEAERADAWIHGPAQAGA